MRPTRPRPIAPVAVVATELSPGRALLRAGVGLLALEAAFAALMLLAASPPIPRRPVVRIALIKPSQPEPRQLVLRRPPPAMPTAPIRHTPPVVIVALTMPTEPRRVPPRTLLLDGQENGHGSFARLAFADRLVPIPVASRSFAERARPAFAADVTVGSVDPILAEISIPPLKRGDRFAERARPAFAADMTVGSVDPVLAEISIPRLKRSDRLAGPAPQWRDGGFAERQRPDRLLADALGIDLMEAYGLHPDPDQELPPLVASASPVEMEKLAASAPTVAELSELFAALDTPMFKNGQVPSVFLDRLPGDLADEPETRRRKALFLRTMLPLIVQANDRSLALRSEVERIDRALADGGALAPEIADSMARLLVEFRLDGWDRAELLRRADMVPPSLALAQAATESGWGSSSFAREGNALFGQREFARTEQSPDRKVPRLRRFDDLAAAVAAYVRNLNTHPAYAEFRNARAALRAGGQVPSGARLVSYLVRYSEQGSVYTRYIQGIMRSNDLAAFDRTQLRRAASEIAIDYPDALTKPRLQ